MDPSIESTIERLHALQLQGTLPQNHTYNNSLPPSNSQLSNTTTYNQNYSPLNGSSSFHQPLPTPNQEILENLQQQIVILQQQNQQLQIALKANEKKNAIIAEKDNLIETMKTEIKQLRLANYHLQYIVQHHNSQQNIHPQPPPDIF